MVDKQIVLDLQEFTACPKSGFEVLPARSVFPKYGFFSEPIGVKRNMAARRNYTVGLCV